MEDIKIFDLLDKIIGHTDIYCSESYDNESYKNMENKIYIINGLISDLETNLLYKGHSGWHSVDKLRNQARENLKNIRDYCQEILDEESE